MKTDITKMSVNVVTEVSDRPHLPTNAKSKIMVELNRLLKDPADPSHGRRTSLDRNVVRLIVLVLSVVVIVNAVVALLLVSI